MRCVFGLLALILLLQLSGDIVTNLQLQIEELKERMLNDEIRQLYGLNDDATPNDVFEVLYIAAFVGKSVMRVTVIDPNGEAVKSCPLAITKSSGNIEKAFTNSKGVYSFLVNANESVTIKTHNDLLDMIGTTSYTAASTGVKTVTLTTVFRNFMSITGSRSAYVSSSCKMLDVSVCGGGGGGGGGSLGSYGNMMSGGGGGGGYGNTKYGVITNPLTLYQITVGSGGNGGIGGADISNTSVDSAPTDGSTGGSSSAFGCSASGGSGGKGGKNKLNPSSYGYGGGGNGNGGNGINYDNVDSSLVGNDGTSGNGTIFDSYTSSINIGGGGGSGGKFAMPAPASTGESKTTYQYSGLPGSPNTARLYGSYTFKLVSHGYESTFGGNVTDARIPGGGGCGGFITHCPNIVSPNQIPFNGTKGASGLVAVRFHH